MNPAIVAAIVSGIFALANPILTLFLKQYFDNRLIQKNSTGRRQAITGRWEGDIKQDKGPNGKSLIYPAQLNLKAGKKSITGTLDINGEVENRKVKGHFTVSGGFLYSDFLRLNYVSNDDSKIQFGSIILKLNSDGTELKGRFCGYGRLTQDIISGNVTFNN